MSVRDFKQPVKNGQPYTIKVSRQLADHTMIEVVFAEGDDTRARERLTLICDAMDDRMIAVNEKILTSTEHINSLVDAKVKAKALNGGGTDGGSIRSADLSANP